MSRYLPIALGILVIVGLTIPQIRMTDRFGETNISAEQKAKLLDNVPRKIGDWVGEDMAVDRTVAQTAGAQGAISRQYRNIRTGEKVDLWLIVGHARPISVHTPDICYRASGFEMRAVENSLYPMDFEGVGNAPFWTNTFIKNDTLAGRRLVRVFWSWYNPHDKGHDGKVVWEAPTNARMYFGNTRALYKMYFTSEMRDASETTEQSSCLRFAREFLPVVNNALAAVHNESNDVGSDLGVADTAAEKTSDEGEASAEGEDSSNDLFGAATDETVPAGDETTSEIAPADGKPSEVAAPATE